MNESRRYLSRFHGIYTSIFLMKILWRPILLTLALYVAVILSFLLADKFDYKHGANDMGNSLMVFAIAVLVVGMFFIRSIYQAISVNRSYWLVAGLHVICIVIFMMYFMV